MTSSTLLPENDGQSTFCPKCRKPDYVSSTWCMYCGWYGVLETHVEIDSSFEQDCESAAEIDNGAVADGDPTLLDGVKSIPFWIYKIGAGILAVTVCLIFFHLATPVGSAGRIVGAVGIVLISMLTFGLAHLYAGIQAVKEEFDFELGDILISPLRIWTSVFAQMPYTFKRTFFACIGLWTLLAVHLIVGVPYTQLQDMTAPEKKFNPLDMISGMAPEGQGEMTVEEMMEKLAAEKAKKKDDEEVEAALTLEQAISKVLSELKTTFSGEEDEKQDKDPEVLTLTMAATVIGYTTDLETGDVQSLVVAIRSDGRWRVAGSAFGVTPEMSETFKAQFQLIERDKPFIKTQMFATWVEPVVRCRIETEYSEKEDRFESVRLMGRQ